LSWFMWLGLCFGGGKQLVCLSRSPKLGNLPIWLNPYICETLSYKKLCRRTY
jgi:hypothetical protein